MGSNRTALSRMSHSCAIHSVNWGLVVHSNAFKWMGWYLTAPELHRLHSENQLLYVFLCTFAFLSFFTFSSDPIVAGQRCFVVQCVFVHLGAIKRKHCISPQIPWMHKLISWDKTNVTAHSVNGPCMLLANGQQFPKPIAGHPEHGQISHMVPWIYQGTRVIWLLNFQ